MNALARALLSQTAPDLELQSRSDEIRKRVGRELERKKRLLSDHNNLNGQGSETEFEDRKISLRTTEAINNVYVPAPNLANSLFLEPSQEWEGYVTAINEETFTARLLDISARDCVESEEADFPIADLSETDHALLKEGAIFRWVIGYQRSLGGTKRRVSQVTFRRLPAWTKRGLHDAKLKAEAILKSIHWD